MFYSKNGGSNSVPLGLYTTKWRKVPPFCRWPFGCSDTFFWGAREGPPVFFLPLKNNEEMNN